MMIKTIIKSNGIRLLYNLAMEKNKIKKIIKNCKMKHRGEFEVKMRNE